MAPLCSSSVLQSDAPEMMNVKREREVLHVMEGTAPTAGDGATASCRERGRCREDDDEASRRNAGARPPHANGRRVAGGGAEKTMTTPRGCPGDNKTAPRTMVITSHGCRDAPRTTRRCHRRRRHHEAAETITLLPEAPWRRRR
ncbi:hypothetical protein SEVIR_8G010650v4 [Setaria viridis]